MNERDQTAALIWSTGTAFMWGIILTLIVIYHPPGRQAVAEFTEDAGYQVSVSLDGSVPIKFEVDSGANVTRVGYEDAEAAGVPVRALRFDHVVGTVGGNIQEAEYVVKDFRFGDIVVKNVRILVGKKGGTPYNLMGADVLRRLSRVEITKESAVMYR